MTHTDNRKEATIETHDIAGINPATAEPLPPDLDQVSEEIVNALPRLSAADQKLAIKLYRLLAEGKPVSRERLAQAVNSPIAEVRQTLNEWPGVYYDENDRVIGFWGLTVKETRHRFEVNSRTLYTWCAWDTLFIPELLNATAHVTSTCATTDETIRLTVSPTAVEACVPSDVVVSFLIPDKTKFQENIIASFCHFVFFFRDREAGGKWVSEHEGTFLLSLKDAITVGKKMNAVRYKDVLGKEGIRL
jgi:alkylmercury lyase